MSEKENSRPICKSVFKSGENAVTSELFTQKWIELINLMERNKEIRDSK